MNDNDLTWYQTVILLLKHHFLGNPHATVLFESAEWRQAIFFKASQIEDSISGNPLPVAKDSSDSPDGNYDQMPPIQMLVAGHSGAREALKDIKEWLRGAEKISICDPYIMHRPKSGLYKSDEDYVSYISSLIPETVKSIKFYGQGFTSEVKSKLLMSLKEGRNILFFSTPEIHDRYIIKDLDECRIIGTSFGGMGNKIFTVLPLPNEDLATLKKYLRQIEKNEPLPE